MGMEALHILCCVRLGAAVYLANADMVGSRVCGVSQGSG